MRFRARSEWPTQPREPDSFDRAPANDIAFDRAGTWLRDDTTLSIRYRPAAHADPVLAVGWSCWRRRRIWRSSRSRWQCSRSYPSRPPRIVRIVPQRRADRRAGELTINWRAYDRTTEPRDVHKVFARTASDAAAVGRLHAVAMRSTMLRSVARSYTDWNPQRFVSEFTPLTKAAVRRVATRPRRRAIVASRATIIMWTESKAGGDAIAELRALGSDIPAWSRQRPDSETRILQH